MNPASLKFYMDKNPLRALANNDGTMSGQVLSGPVRLAFANLAKPKTKQSGKTVYSASLLFPVGTNLDVLKTAIAGCCAEAFGPTWQDMLKKGVIKSPIKKQDGTNRAGERMSDKYDGFEEGGFFVDVQRSTEAEAPPCVDDKKQPLALDKLYSGAWVIAVLRPYAYDTGGNKGVGIGIQSFQFLADDEKFEGNGGNATDAFGIVEHAGGAAAASNASAAKVGAADFSSIL